MPFWIKASGIGGSIVAILALVIVLLKSLIAFVGFLTGALKILIVLVFVALIIGVGFLVVKGIADKRRHKD
jgi:hypothetical protein